RGVEPASPKLRPDFQIVAGRMFEPGRGECVVSRPLSRRVQGGRPHSPPPRGGEEAGPGVRPFPPRGGAPPTPASGRRHAPAFAGSVALAQLRARAAEDRDRLQKTIADAPQFRLMAWRESEFFASQEQSGVFLTVLGTIIAILLTTGAMFAAANTMFAAVRS